MSENVTNFFLVPRIVTGQAGCGKSYFIKSRAMKEGKQILHWSCRRDRTLRDGRQMLHLWAKRSEKSVIWLEGADDLTQESQAFLRRISETHSPLVSFVLECRDTSKLQEPIRSRYSIHTITMPTITEFKNIYPEINYYDIDKYILIDEISHRKIKSMINLAKNHPEDWLRFKDGYESQKNYNFTLKKNEISNMMIQAWNPNFFIKRLLHYKNKYKNIDIINSYSEFIFNNGNPWAYLGYLLSELYEYM